MSYTLNRGIDGDGLDNTQRGLLIGLPAIALILSFGAIHKHANPSANPVSPTTVPVVSTLSLSDGSGDSSGSPSNTGSNPQTAASASGAPAPSYTSPPSSPAPSGADSGTTGVIGGMGGGPAVGGGGGGATIPDCSLNQIATVNCMVPACSPEISLSPGQKAILGLNGTCVIVN